MRSTFWLCNLLILCEDALRLSGLMSSGLAAAIAGAGALALVDGGQQPAREGL